MSPFIVEILVGFPSEIPALSSQGHFRFRQRGRCRWRETRFVAWPFRGDHAYLNGDFQEI